MSNPSYIGATIGAVDSAVGRAPTAGNDLILLVQALGGNPVLDTVADSNGSLIADFVFSAVSAVAGIGVYRTHDAAAGSHSFNVSWTTAPTDYYLTVVEAANVGGVDSSAGTPSITSGNSTTPTTNSLSPPAAGDLLLAFVGIDHSVSSLTWDVFSQIHASIGGPTYSSAYLSDSGSGSIDEEVTLGGVQSWAMLLMAYVGAAANTGIAPNVGADTVTGNAPTVTPAANDVVIPAVARFVRHESGLLIPRERKIFLPTRRAA